MGFQTAVAGDQLGVTYTGWLRDGSDPLKPGKKFDGNANKDKPFAFKLGKGKVIQGWEQGIKGMRKGGRRLLVVPPQFAYGDSARDGIPSKVRTHRPESARGTPCPLQLLATGD